MDIDRAREHWDRRYTAFPAAFDGDVPARVQHFAASLPRGSRVLVLADGSGRDSTYLASRGHRVTAVELSPVGSELARRQARSAGVEVAHVCADAVVWAQSPANKGNWDGVLSYFGHLGAEANRGVAAALRPRLATGAHVLVVTSRAVDTAAALRENWGPEAVVALEGERLVCTLTV